MPDSTVYSRVARRVEDWKEHDKQNITVIDKTVCYERILLDLLRIISNCYCSFLSLILRLAGYNNFTREHNLGSIDDWLWFFCGLDS
jgi:hypothetical protein